MTLYERSAPLLLLESKDSFDRTF